MMSLVSSTTWYSLSLRGLSDLDFAGVDRAAHTVVRCDPSGLDVAALLSELSCELRINR